MAVGYLHAISATTAFLGMFHHDGNYHSSWTLQQCESLIAVLFGSMHSNLGATVSRSQRGAVVIGWL